MNARKQLLVIVTVAAAVTASAIPSRQMREWAEGPARHLMTAEEISEWERLSDDLEARQFIDLFWARRDPTPDTQRNEFKERFEETVDYSDEHFGETNDHGVPIKGSMTPRGKTAILLGMPSRISNYRVGTQTYDEKLERDRGQVGPITTWVWEKDKLPFLGNRQIQIVFSDHFNRGNWSFYEYAGTDGRYNSQKKSNVATRDAFEKAAKFWIVNPDIKVARYTAPEKPRERRIVSVTPAEEALKAFRTEALRKAVDGFVAGGTSLPVAQTTYGEFISPRGDYFVPLQIYVPRTLGVQPDPAMVFFAEVKNPRGEVVRVYEEPAPLNDSRSDRYFEKSLRLEPGNYTAVVGLARGSEPLVIGKLDLALAPLTATAASASRLIISNNVYALDQPQQLTDPFAFGGMKVVPKGDRAFTRADDLWYFVELRNPAVGTAGAPEFDMQIALEGSSGGQPVKMVAPFEPANVLPLKGVEGHFGVGSSIPLETFAPGDYSIRITLRDKSGSQTYTREEKFRITG